MNSLRSTRSPVGEREELIWNLEAERRADSETGRCTFNRAQHAAVFGGTELEAALAKAARKAKPANVSAQPADACPTDHLDYLEFARANTADADQPGQGIEL